MNGACCEIDQPTCVSTRFLNLWAATCATGYAAWARSIGRQPDANTFRLMNGTCCEIDQPTCVSTRFLNLWAATCATGYDAYARSIGRQPDANAFRLMNDACRGIDQPTCVSTRFLQLLAVTCATGYASVSTIGGLQVACVESCLGKVVSLESYCKPSARRALAKPVAHKTCWMI